MNDITEYVKDRLAHGWSQLDLASALDMTLQQFRQWRDLHPEIDWPPASHSIACRRAVVERNRARKGICTAPMLASINAAREIRRQSFVVEAFGKKGTLRELCKEFAVVSRQAVLKRMQSGMSLEEALTAKRKDTAVMKNSDDHIWNRERNAHFASLPMGEQANHEQIIC